MSTSSPRLGRISSPPRPAGPHAPVCRQCTTDYYLKFLVFAPTAAASQATADSRKRRRNHGLKSLLRKLSRTSGEASGGRVEYFCQKCGSFHDHHFPAGWEPAARILTADDIEDLPAVYVGPGESRPAAEVTRPLFGVAQQGSPSA
ncbi:hypothetical protein FCK90_09935 [Kocuria coralli]|uniref:Uncharacterized protein n=1 Tax=Kocuria coralli TaxID=1461025 RepID=A0A5J5KWE7_9MICC|nr:hypothetical protein [Kocuria coralli]KAA9393969.1 hypothetical protein FCK90_09935 [Kocuria coralli]